MMRKRIKIIAMAVNWPGFSGGDRIFIELARRWNEKINVEIYTWQAGLKVLKEQRLRQNSKLKFIEWRIGNKIKNIFIMNYFARIITAIQKSLTLKVTDPDTTMIFSASEFWMDSFPAFILKIRFPNSKWLAAWYQTAPNPLFGYSEDANIKRYRLGALIYWLVQQPARLIIIKKADYIFVNNEEERKNLVKQGCNGKVIVLLGAVRLEEIENWKLKNGNIPKLYDAVFQGRFHPQKGVVELIEIWKKVVDKIPNAMLAMIGDGPLMKDVRDRIQELGLNKKVKLFGYVFDGPEKYKIFSQSKMVVHPSYYDSGGMSAAEAMAFGLPVIGFKLKAYESYYPNFMVKIEKGDLEAFSKNIINLIGDKKKRHILGEKAYEFIKDEYSWNKRSEEIISKINT